MTDRPSRPKRIAFVGSHIPRRCGIATFTADLAESVASADPASETWVVAMNDRPEGYRYPHRVKFEINDGRLPDYRLAAEFLNTSHVDVVSLQHEYGIFGDEDGRRVNQLLRQLQMPVVTTLHTVLRDPTPGQRRVMLELADLSQRLVVMAERAVTFLTDIYQVPASKIVHVPHGIPEVPFIDPNYYKDKFGAEGRKVILTFGLLSPNKGIETMIDAMASIVEAYPDALYFVLGATHPHVQASFGEDYRKTLQRRAAEQGVEKNVVFHNRYVDIHELCEFLGVADVYVTPYLNEAQICSGTLAYALGTGNAVVSTPYWYATELLDDQRGRIVPFQSPGALAETVIDLFHDEVQRHAMRKRGYQHTRPFVWSSVAKKYHDVFDLAVADHRRQTEKPPTIATVSTREPELPEVRLDHLRAMTDDTSILQHAVGGVPNLHYGYATDDAARALIVTLVARNHTPSGSGCTDLARRYLAFLHFAFNDQAGRFRNFLGYDRHWQETVGSDDAHGRSLWALGETVASTPIKAHLGTAVQLFHRALPAMSSIESPRAWAYAVIGIHAYLRRFAGDTGAKRCRGELATRLMQVWDTAHDGQWPWPEESLTYGNARLPQALLLCGQWMFQSEMVDRALHSLEWLWSVQVSPEGHFAPIGCNGWHMRHGPRARFDQQALEAHGMIDAALEAHRVTRDPNWLDRAFTTFNWFLGDNDLKLPLYDPASGACYDGLQAHGVNENQGAESVVSWLLSLLAMHDYALPALRGETPDAACRAPEVNETSDMEPAPASA